MKWKTPSSQKIEWNSSIINYEEKNLIAKHIAMKVKDGQTIGVGSGSTAFLAIQRISERVHADQINVWCIPTSLEVEMACSALNLTTTSLRNSRPDWSFDGADEVDERRRMIKGRGGAMLREKILMNVSPLTYILVDSTKFVTKLGERFPVPVEVHPDAVYGVEEAIIDAGSSEIALRLAKSKDGPVLTENGNLILDVRFECIDDSLESTLKCIPGVIETGIFTRYTTEIIGAA